MSKYKKWSLETKLEILEKAKSGDVVEVCRSYGVSTGTFYNWRNKFEVSGEEGLLRKQSKHRDKDLAAAQEKIRVLSKLLADRDVELEVQRELLKKKFGTSNLKKI